MTVDGAATPKREIAMKPKATRKPSKQLKKGGIETVKSLRIHVRKADRGKTLEAQKPLKVSQGNISISKHVDTATPK